MATIVKGTTFSGSVTAGGMHAMVESATIANIDRASMRTTEITVATQSPSAPASPTANEVWQIYPSNGLVSYDIANSRWSDALPTIRRYTNEAGTAITAGNTLMTDGGGTLTQLSLQKATSAAGLKLIGVALNDVAAGAVGWCVIAGPALVACIGTVTAGESVKQSSTDGAVESVALGSGVGWQFFGSAIGNSSGGFVWVTLRR